VWAVLGRFFQSLPIPCGASPDVTSPNVTDSREKRNQGLGISTLEPGKF